MKSPLRQIMDRGSEGLRDASGNSSLPIKGNNI